MLKGRWLGGEDFRSGRRESQIADRGETKRILDIERLDQVADLNCSRQREEKCRSEKVEERSVAKDSLELAMRQKKCLASLGRADHCAVP